MTRREKKSPALSQKKGATAVTKKGKGEKRSEISKINLLGRREISRRVSFGRFTLSGDSAVQEFHRPIGKRRGKLGDDGGMLKKRPSCI